MPSRYVDKGYCAEKGKDRILKGEEKKNAGIELGVD